VNALPCLLLARSRIYLASNNKFLDHRPPNISP
jgi:hypothetical protein